MKRYVDSSVVLRVLFNEPNQLADWANGSFMSSELLRVECLRVVDRARLSRGLDDDTTARLRSDTLDLVSRIPQVPVTTEVMQRAADPFPTLLRTLDAIHLATALALRVEYGTLTFATHDVGLAAAARSVGFPVAGA